MFVLDTNVVSELRKAGQHAGRMTANKNVVAWIEARAPDTMFISAITILELEHGVLLIAGRDAPQGARLRTWLNRLVLPSFRGRVLPVDTAVARRCAALHVPDPRSERDALIAATAIEHGMTVVTRNVRDFTATGARVVDPWGGG